MAKTAEQRIEKAHLLIMKHPTFCAWSGLLFMGGWEVVNAMPPGVPNTAYVVADGKVTYSRSFIDGLVSEGGAEKEVNFVVLHENAHKALLHLIRGRPLFEANPQIASIAADHVVNNMIEEIDPEHKFAQMPKSVPGWFDLKYRGWSMKEVYNDLLKNPPPQSAQSMDGHMPGFVEGEKDPSKRDELEQKMEQQVLDALRSGSYLAGKMGGKQSRSLLDLLEPKIDWRDALREFVSDTCMGDDEASWIRPHRRFVGVDVYLPTSISETIGEIVACIDTSGSIGHKEMTAMVSELVAIADTVHPAGIRLIYWSDGVESEEYYTPGEYDTIASKTKPVGGGGTTIAPVAERLKELENIQCAVILTDGYIYGAWGDWPCPTLFAITTDVVSPIGKTVHFEV